MFLAPGLHELGPADCDRDCAPRDMNIECCEICRISHQVSGFRFEKTVVSEALGGVSDRIEANADCGDCNNGKEDLFFGFHLKRIVNFIFLRLDWGF